MRAKLPFFLFLAAVTAVTFLAYTHFHPQAPKTEAAAKESHPFAILSAPSIRWTTKAQPGGHDRLHLGFKVEASAPLYSLSLQVSPVTTAKGLRVSNEQHEIPTWLMGNKSIDWDGEMDLTGSLMAGQAAKLQIVAEDEDHRRSESDPITLNLPEHHFSQPLAQALYSLRKSLQENPTRRNDALRALAVLLQQRPTFEHRDLSLLTLRSAAVRIALDGTEEGLQSSLNLLWHAAMLFEENPSSNVAVTLRLVPQSGAPAEKPE